MANFRNLFEIVKNSYYYHYRVNRAWLVLDKLHNAAG